MCEDASLRALFLSRNEQVCSNTAFGIHSSTIDTSKSGQRPTIAITPPDDSPRSQPSQRPSHAFENNHILTGLGVIPQEPVPPEQAVWRQNDEAESSRGRSRSHTDSFEDQYRSFSPSPARRRFGMIDLADFDSGSDNRRSSLDMHNAEVQYDQTGTNLPYPTCTVGQPDAAAAAAGQVTLERPIHSFDEGLPQSQEGHHNQSFLDTGTRETAAWWNIKNQRTPKAESTPAAGKWRCCACQRGHDIYRLGAGVHLLSILSCLCKHRSCRSCTFDGKVRRFAPIDDIAGVASIPVTGDDGENNRFGVVCRTCGLSWRAETTQKPKSQTSLRRRLSILPKKVNPLQKLRHTRSMIHLGLSREHHPDGRRPSTAVSTSRAVLNLRAASDSHARSDRLGEQAQGADVRFYGIQCTCGTVTDSNSLCFQFVDVPEASDGVLDVLQGKDAAKAVKPYVTPELRAKGYRTPLLHLKGGSHPNPLLSHPAADTRSSYN